MRYIFLSILGITSILSADFSREAVGIVTDTTTALEWQDNEVGSLTTWTEAIDRCEALELGGHQDWRLPNIRELLSLVDDTKFVPSISSSFTNIISNNYWSSTTYASNTSYAWVVCFSYGNDYHNAKTNSNYVRCVRDN